LLNLVLVIYTARRNVGRRSNKSLPGVSPRAHPVRCCRSAGLVPASRRSKKTCYCKVFLSSAGKLCTSASENEFYFGFIESARRRRHASAR